MQIRVLVIVATLVSGMLTATPALADQPAITPEERFRDLELKWMDALADKDVAVLEQILAKEFTIIGAGSTLENPAATREEWLAVGLKRPFPKHTVRVVAVTQLPDVAVVQAVLTGDYPPMPWVPEGGTLNFLITDTWVYRDGRWQVAARHSSLPVASGSR